MNIILIGFKAAGKSTIGRKLSKRTGMDFIDLDSYIVQLHDEEKRENINCREIFNKYGERYFRELEKNALNAIKTENTVLAVGGGAVESEKNRSRIKRLGKVIYLFNNKDILFSRIENQGLPPFMDSDNPRESFETLFKKRDLLYKTVADDIIICDNLSYEDILDEIIKVME
ncbi:AAA family ATPase [Candidatus Woesearchaeota archaeon]|nr:AAA family ATPase [Candidatus Woesearchaeota archaeon]